MRVLVLEDEALVAMDLADVLRNLGETVVGPCLTVADALHLLDSTEVDFGILDFNLRHETSEALADTLLLRSIPFVFLTGYRRTGLPEKFADVPIFAKPFDERSLADELARQRGAN